MKELIDDHLYVDFVVVACAQVNHDMLVAEEEHDRTGIYSEGEGGRLKKDCVGERCNG